MKSTVAVNEHFSKFVFILLETKVNPRWHIALHDTSSTPSSLSSQRTINTIEKRRKHDTLFRDLYQVSDQNEGDKHTQKRFNRQDAKSAKPNRWIQWTRVELHRGLSNQTTTKDPPSFAALMTKLPFTPRNVKVLKKSRRGTTIPCCDKKGGG